MLFILSKAAELRVAEVTGEEAQHVLALNVPPHVRGVLAGVHALGA